MLFLSGASALLFQTLWLRLAGLVFGNSVWSAALILSSFMAGLALGGAAATSAKLRRFQPLKLYAALELTIAVCGCAIVFVLPSAGQLLRPIFRLLFEHSAALNALRFVLSFVILLVPGTAMGLTLPVLLGDQALRAYTFGFTVGLLYGVNTLGAVAGAVLGEAWLVRAFGLAGTSVCAALMNITAATLAYSLPLGMLETAPAVARQTSSRHVTWRLCIVSFGCGAVLLALEVIWFRFLQLYVASSATAFAAMLSIVLAGIGMGGLLAAPLSKHRKINNWLPVLLVSAGVVTVICYLVFPVPTYRPEEGYYIEAWQSVAVLAAALIFPVALISGIVFPLVLGRVYEQFGEATRTAGMTLLFNTVGAALGPLIAAFLLLPRFGYHRAMLLAAGCYIALGALLIRRSQTVVILVFTVCVAGFVALLALPKPQDHLASPRRPYIEGGLKLVDVIEGTSGTFQLLRRDLYGQPYYYRLLTNSYSMSATNPPNQRYMRLFAYLPRVFAPEAKNALLICYGLGATADALLRGNQLERVDIVDIAKEVFALSPLHSDDLDPDPLQNSKARAFIQDGRFFLQANAAKYDVITGEPPPPKVLGSVNLYTEEFFKLLNAALTENGVATFWLPIYQLKVTETKAILRAFHDAFPNSSVWASSDYEWIMLGVKGPGQAIAETRIAGFWRDSATAADLRRIGVETPEQLGALFVMDGDEIARITSETQPLTDLWPKRLSDALTDAPADVQATDEFAWPYIEAAQAIRRFEASPLMARVWPAALNRSLQGYFIARETRYLARVSLTNRYAELDLYLRRSTLRVPVLEILGSDEFRVALAHRAADQDAAASDLIADAVATRDMPRAVQLLNAAIARRPDAGDVRLLVYLQCVTGEIAEAETTAATHRDLLMQDDETTDLWQLLRTKFGFHPPT